MKSESGKQFGGDKMLQHLDRLSLWQSGALPVPVTVEMDVTNLCNHACPGCTFSYLVNVDKSSLPFDLARKTIADIAQMGVKALTFSGGGEPLVYGQERIIELANTALDAKMDVALITNGSLLTPERSYERFSWVRISLDAYDEETFARFHGRKSKEFDKVVERVKRFAAAGESARSSGRPWPTVGVGFLTDAETLARDDIEKMAAFCSQTFPGLDYLQFRPLVMNMVVDPLSKRAGLSLADHAEIAMGIAQAQRWNRDRFQVLWSEEKYRSLTQPQFGREYHRCLAHFLEAVVSADGKVHICCHTQGQEQFSLGNLHEESFKDIWFGERAKLVYDSFDPRDVCPAACRLHLQNTILHDLSRGVVHKNFI